MHCPHPLVYLVAVVKVPPQTEMVPEEIRGETSTILHQAKSVQHDRGWLCEGGKVGFGRVVSCRWSRRRRKQVTYRNQNHL